ncbi:craniofacial development protein 2-like [Solenopsis invicta]|uniref:craniofacial development protein 2-like n=1 Tax=Solenopsis invicta TaxID=13686 RepID=UPI00193CF4C9|nr:craniofacial development protein 2-like [Solenopsis invicta]
MRSEEHLAGLERELKNIKWNVLGISEIRLTGEAITTLKSGHLLFQRNSATAHLGGVALLIHSKIKHLVTKTKAVLDRIIYALLRLNQRYSLQIIQAYAPASAQNEDIEQFYENLMEARVSEKAHFVIIIGDFNAKIGQRTPIDTAGVGRFGLGTRNSRGQMLVDFLSGEGMYCMNTFFQKKPKRKWTWRSRGGAVRNEIDYILSSSKDICEDVSVLGRFDAGSVHRLVRACFRIDTKLERRKLMRKCSQPSRVELKRKEREYQSYLERKLNPMDELSYLELDALNLKITSSIQTTVKRVWALRKESNSKITPDTERLIEERRNTNTDFARYTQLNKEIRKAIRRNVRANKAREIERAIEDNMNLLDRN